MLKLSNYFPFSFFRRTSGGTGTDFSLKLRLNSRRSGTRKERQMTWMIPSHKQSLMLFYNSIYLRGLQGPRDKKESLLFINVEPGVQKTVYTF